MIDPGLDGRVAMVTGANQGIGAAAVCALAAQGVYPPVTGTGWISHAVRAAAAKASPLGRVAGPEDVADVIVFLASGQARHVTGQIIRMS